MKTLVTIVALVAIAAPVRAQKADHVAALLTSERAVAHHAHELVHMPNAKVTKASASPHVTAMTKSLDDADKHLAAVEKEKTDAKAKLNISEIRRDHESARKHIKETDAALAKPKLDVKSIKEHAEGVDGAIDDASDLTKKLNPPGKKS